MEKIYWLPVIESYVPWNGIILSWLIPECKDRFGETEPPSYNRKSGKAVRVEYVWGNFATRTEMSPASGDVSRKDLREALVCSERVRYRLYVRALLNKRVSHAAGKVPTFLLRKWGIPLSENNERDDSDFPNILSYEMRPRLSSIHACFRPLEKVQTTTIIFQVNFWKINLT